MASSFDTYKFDGVGDENNPWMDFEIGPNNYQNIVIGVNMKDEIEKRWGSVDTANYIYTFGLVLKYETSDGGTQFSIIGASSPNTNSFANTNKSVYTCLGRHGCSVGGVFKKENGGIFCSNTVYYPNRSFRSSGSIQTTDFNGVSIRRNPGSTSCNYESGYTLDFSCASCNPKSGCGSPGSNCNNKEGTHENLTQLFEDLGACAGAYVIDQSLGIQISTNEINSGSDIYFSYKFDMPWQGRDAEWRRGEGMAVSICKSSSPYFTIQEKLYTGAGLSTEQNSYLNRNGQYGMVILPNFASNSKDNICRNTYWKGNDVRNFNTVGFTTVILRCRKIFDNSRGVWWQNETWGWNATGNSRSGDNSFYYAYRNRNYTNDLNTTQTRASYGYALHGFAKFSSNASYVSNTPVTSYTQSQLWNNTKEIEWDGSSWHTFVFSGVKGVGNFVTISITPAIKCLNIQNCSQNNPVTGNLEIIDCSTVNNAPACVDLNSGTTNDGYLGWNTANENTYCNRYPDDVVCGCSNTINNPDLNDFITKFQDQTGIYIPPYCFSQECSPPTDSWLDPRMDRATCPNSLTFCLTFIDFVGNNNTLKDTQIYQDCSKEINGGGGDKTISSTTTYIIIGVFVALILIGLIIFFVMRRKASP